MYVALAWLCYLLAATLALHLHHGASYAEAVLYAAVGAAFVYLLAGGLGHWLAERSPLPGWERQASATVAATLTLVALLYLVSAPR